MKKIKGLLLALAVGIIALPVHAAVELPSELGDTLGMSDASIGTIIGNIINIVLGLLGFVLVILIIWSGVEWMTAGGDSGKVDKAKTRLLNSVIGLAIVLAAWAVASFVVDNLSSAVSDGGGGYGM